MLAAGKRQGAGVVATDDDTIRFYDLTAESVADEWYPNEVLMPAIQEFVALLPENPRVLDLGCGPGHEGKRLALAGAEVVGVDFSAECIRVARERCPESRFEELDFRDLDARFGTFHGVFAAGSLIHMEPDVLPMVIGRIAGILRPNGYLLGIVQDGKGVRETWPVVRGEKLRRIVYLYSEDEIVAAAEPRLAFVRRGFLARELLDHGWQSYLFRLRG
jgi:SAM-dependent methyltransferase